MLGFMLFCLKCRKNTENRNLEVAKTKIGRIAFIKTCNV